MRQQLPPTLKQQLRRLLALGIAAGTTYKAVIAIFSRCIPGDPFYGFAVHQWLWWIVTGPEVLLAVGLAVFEYYILYYFSRRLSTRSLVLWGMVLGPYVALWFFPFDWMQRIDTLPSNAWPSGLLGVVLELVLLLGALPLALLAIVQRLQRLWQPPTAAEVSLV